MMRLDVKVVECPAPARYHPSVTAAADEPAASRLDRRKARTRAALIEAAQDLLARQARAEVSIQEITDRADVGFGSFYNHFATKDELFDEAVALTLVQHAELMESLTTDLEDPAEVFAASFRLTGRLARQRPAMVQVLVRTGLTLLSSGAGLSPHAQDDIRRGVASGRFVVEDIRVALLMVGGSLLGLLQVLDSVPDPATADLLTDALVRQLLVGLGLTREEAREVCDRPLPSLAAQPSAGG